MSSNVSRNSTGNLTDFESTEVNHTFPRGPISQEDIQVIATAFFSLISVIGVSGNFLVILTLIRWREMRTPCNLLITNISVADLVVTLFMAPLRVIEQYAKGWIFGEVLCYVFAPLQDALVSISVFTFTAIAMERYRAIVDPFKPRMDKKQVKILIGIIWVGCYVGTALPVVFFVSHLEENGVFYCFANFPEEDFHMFAIYLVVVFIALPLLVQMLSYIRVIVSLSKKDAIEKHCDANSSQLQREITKHRSEKKRRLIKMLIVLMLIFQVCYIPRGVIMMIMEFAPFLTRNVAFAYVNIVTMLLYYVKHIMNPIILFGMSQDFRAGFSGVCKCSSQEEFSSSNSGSACWKGRTQETKIHST